MVERLIGAKRKEAVAELRGWADDRKSQSLKTAKFDEYP